MGVEFARRDYSLVGPEKTAGHRAGPRHGDLVFLPDPAQAPEGADAAQGRAGDPRHDHLVRRLRGDRRARLPRLGHLVGGPLLHRLWRPLRLLLRFALARMRPRHRLQDPLDERRRLPDRLLHGAARAGALALEPYAPPHRHDHRRPRSGDRRAAPARHRRHPDEPLHPEERPEGDQTRLHALLRKAAPGGEGIHPRVRISEGVPHRPHLGRQSGRPSWRRASRPARSCRRCMSASCRRSMAAGSIWSSG